MLGLPQAGTAGAELCGAAGLCGAGAAGLCGAAGAGLCDAARCRGADVAAGPGAGTPIPTPAPRLPGPAIPDDVTEIEPSGTFRAAARPLLTLTCGPEKTGRAPAARAWALVWAIGPLGTSTRVAASTRCLGALQLPARRGPGIRPIGTLMKLPLRLALLPVEVVQLPRSGIGSLPRLARILFAALTAVLPAAPPRRYRRWSV